MISISIDPSSRREQMRLLRDFEKKAGRAVEDSVVELGRSAGRQLAHKVPPWGLNAQVGKKFEGSVAKQVNRAVRAANVGAVSGSNAEQAHKAARDSKGQVPRLLRTTGKRVRNQIGVRDKEVLVDRKQEAAGTAKGAWITAAVSLNGKPLAGIARWISRHRKSGRSRLMRRGISTEAEITNELPYIQRLQTPAMIKSALKQAYQNTFRAMKRLIEKL